MPRLREIQRGFAAAMFGEADDIARHVSNDGIAAEDRIRIYRHTAFSALTAALQMTFPAVERLVGTEFFARAADAFIRESPPETAYLGQYGGAFGDFLAAFPPAAALAYLPDVARFEWALNVAANAPDAIALDVSALAAVDPAEHGRVRFVPHPSLSLIRSDYPVDQIADAVLARDDAAIAAVALSSGQIWLTVHRGPHGVEAQRLTEGEWQVTKALCAGRALMDAFDASAVSDPVALLADHLARGRFTRYLLPKERRA